MGIFDFLKPKPKHREPRTWREAAAASTIPTKGFYVHNPKAVEEEFSHYRKLGITHVVIRTSEDQRVCAECRKHSRKKYQLENAPRIPMCEECRCYYEPVIIPKRIR